MAASAKETCRTLTQSRASAGLRAAAKARKARVPGTLTAREYQNFSVGKNTMGQSKRAKALLTIRMGQSGFTTKRTATATYTTAIASRDHRVNLGRDRALDTTTPVAALQSRHFLEDFPFQDIKVFPFSTGPFHAAV